MNNKQIKDLINDGYSMLSSLANFDWRDYRQEMLDYELKAEKDHRKNCPWNLSTPCSSKLIAQYFVLRGIFSATGSMSFRPRDILHCKLSHLIAHGLNDDHRFDLYGMMEGFNWDAFNSIEYSQGNLISVETVKEVA